MIPADITRDLAFELECVLAADPTLVAQWLLQ